MSGPVTAALHADGVVVRASGSTLLEGADLRAPGGRSLAVLGPNGAGKTTLFRALAGAVPTCAGRIWLLGRDVTDQPLHRRARAGLGYLPQGPSAFRDLTVRDNLRTVLELRAPGGEREARLQALLDELDLRPLRDRRASDLSGGERRRLEVARLLAAAPRVLLLDEPFSDLDPRSADDLAERLRAAAERGLAVVFSDHEPARALAIGDRAVVLAGGRVVAEGAPDDVRQAPEARRVYFPAARAT